MCFLGVKTTGGSQRSRDYGAKRRPVVGITDRGHRVVLCEIHPGESLEHDSSSQKRRALGNMGKKDRQGLVKSLMRKGLSSLLCS